MRSLRKLLRKLRRAPCMTVRASCVSSLRRWEVVLRAASLFVQTVLQRQASVFSVLLHQSRERQVLHLNNNECFEHAYCDLRVIYADHGMLELFCTEHNVHLGNQIRRP